MMTISFHTMIYSETCIPLQLYQGISMSTFSLWGAKMLEKPAFVFIWLWEHCASFMPGSCFELVLIMLSIGLSACLLEDIDSLSACGVSLRVWGGWHSLNGNVLQHWEVLRKEITINQELATILIWSTEFGHDVMVVPVFLSLIY